MNMPKTNAKVRVKAMSSFNGRNLFPVGTIAYVSSHKGSYENGSRIPVSMGPNDRFGYYWCTDWEVVDGIDAMSGEDKQELTDRALAAATKRGYCNETKNILADIGLPTESSVETKTVTVKVTYTVRNGYTFDPGYLKYDDSYNGPKVIEIVSAKKVFVPTPKTDNAINTGNANGW
jgi:hypothetical protein